MARRLADDGLAVAAVDIDEAACAATADAIAHAVSFLVSPQAGFVSGHVLYVAGGPVG